MTYEDALASYKAAGASNADEPALLAGYCKNVLQTIVGAVSPKLVWQGAQASGLSSLELASLSITEPMAVSDLQWL